MEKSVFIKRGKVLSAIVSIAIAGCLIKKEQETNVSNFQDEVLVEVKTPQPSTKIVTSGTFVSSEIANASVTEIAITVDGAVKKLSEMNPAEVKEVLVKVDSVVKGPTLFSTSKSMIPPIDDDRFYLFVYKENHKHVVNYTSLYDKTWELALRDMQRFYNIENGEQNCNSKILYTKHSDLTTSLPIDLLSLKNTEIRSILLEVDQVRNENLILFSSSKALAPPVNTFDYIFTVNRNDEESDYSAVQIDSIAWDSLRKEIEGCLSISMDYLYIVEP
jgi:hypothetical protein